MDAKKTKKDSGQLWLSSNLPKKCHCGGLNDLFHVSLWPFNTWTLAGGCLGRIRGHGLVGEGVSLRVGLRF